MYFEGLEISPVMLFRLGALLVVIVLLVLLIISFRSRSRVFCQYLKFMTGIDLKVAQVNRVYRANGRGGVRDLLIDLIIQEDLSDPARQVMPGAKPKPSIYESGVFDK